MSTFFNTIAFTHPNECIGGVGLTTTSIIGEQSLTFAVAWLTVCCLTFARLSLYSLYCVVLLTVRHLYSSLFFVVFIAILATLTTAFRIVFIYLRITKNMRIMWVKKFSHLNGNFVFNWVQLKLLHSSEINGIQLNYTLAWRYSWLLLN